MAITLLGNCIAVLPKSRVCIEVVVYHMRLCNKYFVFFSLVASGQHEKNINDIAPTSRDTIINHSGPVVNYGDEMTRQTRNLKQFLRLNLYQHYKVNRMTNKANQIIQALFDAFMSDPYLLPPETLYCIRDKQGGNDDIRRARVISDYIAGMTDRYAIEEYRRLFNVTQLSS